MTVRMAFTGTGWVAKVHAEAAKKLQDVKLVAAVNHRPESLSAFASEYAIPRQYAKVSEMLADCPIDVLVVCTPNYLHAPETITALQAGVHVLVEKPMAMNAFEAEEMAAAASRNNALLMVAHCYRFDPEVIWLKQQLMEGRLGKIIRTTSYGVHVAWGPAGWFNQKDLSGGGALVDMGIHALDTSRFLLNDPQPISVYARVGTYYRPIEVDDTGLLWVEWDNGAISTIESGWWQPHAQGVCGSTLLYGTRGFGRVFPTKLEIFHEAERVPVVVDSGFSPSRIEEDFYEMYRNQLAYFLDCVHSGQQPDPDPRESSVNMRILDAAYESSITGKVVKL